MVMQKIYNNIFKKENIYISICIDIHIGVGKSRFTDDNKELCAKACLSIGRRPQRMRKQ